VNVLVTNGYVNEAPLRALLPSIDAMNIDLKAFTEEFYRTLYGHLAPVKRTISIAAEACHVEVTTLIVPGMNDNEDEMRALSAWLAGVRDDIPLHISRFFPRYRMADGDATPVETIFALADIARERLKYVYTGNC
jgi:pyruvate formate lyase activating enzyme